MLRRFTAEYITRTIFDETKEPGAFEKLAAKFTNKAAGPRNLTLNEALKKLRQQGLSKKAADIVEQQIHSTMSDNLHNVLFDLALNNAEKSGSPVGATVIHNIRWSNNYYLGAGIVSPRIDLKDHPNIVKAMREECKEALFAKITMAHFLFKNENRQRIIDSLKAQ